MGFKIIGRKNGKKTVSDNPDNDATKVTSSDRPILLTDTDIYRYRYRYGYIGIGIG